MNKVVYNEGFGGFSLSTAALKWLVENGSDRVKSICKTCLKTQTDFSYLISIERHDKDLVRCVETLGRAANGLLANLRVRKIKGNRYRIDEYDGYEQVFEPEDEEYVTIE